MDFYEGIELFIDPEAGRSGVSVLRENFGLKIEELSGRYCPDGDTFIAKLPLADELSEKALHNGSVGNPVSRCL